MGIKSGKIQTYKNLIMNIVAFGVQFIISFYISPIIVKEVGASAYGFIGLANDFVSYVSLLATVFNSVASRFIANAFYQKDFDKANNYFNSLIVTNIIIAGILGFAGMILVPNLDKLLVVSAHLITDVKLTFALIFASYIVSLVTLIFTTSTFISNRADIQGVRNIINYIVRFAFIIIFLNFISIKIYWVAVATLLASIIVAVMNVKLTKRLTPEIKINLKSAKVKYSIELAKAGVWMVLTSLSTILLRGMDLTVANVILGDYEMGLLSIARTMPNNVTNVISTISPIFTPIFIMAYAKKNQKKLVADVKSSIKIMVFILYVPISVFIVFSYDFYRLWQSSLTEDELIVVTILSTITIIQAYFNSATSTMAQVSVVVNKLKIPVLVSITCGVVSFILEFALIWFTDLGIYAIAISTTIVMIIRYIAFNSAYAADCLEKPWNYFFSTLIRTWLFVPILLIVFLLIRWKMPVGTWVNFFVDVILCAIIGYILMFIIYGRKSITSISNIEE